MTDATEDALAARLRAVCAEINALFAAGTAGWNIEPGAGMRADDDSQEV